MFPIDDKIFDLSQAEYLKKFYSLDYANNNVLVIDSDGILVYNDTIDNFIKLETLKFDPSIVATDKKKKEKKED
jgi:hypothetical protein